MICKCWCIFLRNESQKMNGFEFDIALLCKTRNHPIILRRQKTKWSDVFSLQSWQGIGLGCHQYWLLNQQPILHHFEHRFSVKRGRGLEETKIFSTCGRLRVCSRGCWNIRDDRLSRMLPFNWHRPPHFEGHQSSPTDVLHLSTDFSCHFPMQRTGYWWSFIFFCFFFCLELYSKWCQVCPITVFI